MSTPTTPPNGAPEDQNNPLGAVNEHSHSFTMMLQMQQQQMAMQQQITQLLSHLVPVNVATTSPPTTHNHHRSMPTRPIIEADCTDNKWVIFKDAWTRYKQMTSLQNPNEIRNELRSSCSTAVNELLFNFVGPAQLNAATEAELLDHIKSVAVKTVHPEVYRQQFFRIKQSDGENITHFVSRLKSQAMLCDFVRKCDNGQCDTSYSSNMIISQLIAGLYNQSHQSKVLSEVSTLKTLEQLVERLLVLESTANAASHFQPQSTSDVCPIKSEYQRGKSTNTFRKQSETGDTQTKCFGCGKKLHEQGRKQCPAHGRKCNKCGKMNHFASVCMSSSRSSSAAITEDNDSLFISSCTEEL